MATKVVTKRIVGLGPTSNVQYVATEGQKIKTGDPLLIFENDFNEKDISDLLSSIGTEYEQDIQDLASRSIRSKHTGIIKKINIYYNVELDEMTESMRNMVQKYIDNGTKRYNKAKNTIKSNSQFKDISLDVDVPNVEKINSDKINGENVDGVMIEFFIEYEDDLKVGDKVSKIAV